LEFEDIEQLLKSKIHEERLVGLVILTEQFKRADQEKKQFVYKFYLKNAKLVNNWDLVDLSADKIVGEYLLDKDWLILKELARSDNLWQKRIAIVSTYAFIKKGHSQPTLKVAEILLNDPHDLIKKAVGWMLREVGKRVSQSEEEQFLKNHYQSMSRTTLRYAIERFPEQLRKKYLLGQI
jgi:3-methyladenine DNA glycosylase AlkD